MKLKIDYSKGYPSQIDDIKIDGLYEILLEHRGTFIDYYYKNVDTSKLSHIYIKIEKFNESTEFKDNFVFVVNRVIETKYKPIFQDKYIFWVDKNSNIKFTSKDFLPIANILKTFVREYKINDILN